MKLTVNLLHISDLHLCKGNLGDARVVVRAFLHDLAELIEREGEPDLICFTGDLVQDGSAPESYGLLLDDFLIPLLDSTSLSENEIFLCPGNHDASRETIGSNKKFFDYLRKDIDDNAKLNNIINNENYNEYISTLFNNFHVFRHALDNKYILDSNEITQPYYIPDCNTSIIAVNSAWMTGAGLFGEDKGNLLIPTAGVLQQLDNLPDNCKKIILTHHPLEWISEYNQTNIIPSVAQNFDVHLFGHVHSARPVLKRAPDSALFEFQAGALYQSSDKFQGYSYIKLGSENKYIKSIVRNYFPERGQFSSAENVCPQGIFYSETDAKSYFDTVPRRTDLRKINDWLDRKLQPLLCKSLDIGFADRPTSEVFVEPALYRSFNYRNSSPTSEEDYPDKGDDVPVPFSELVRSTDNYILYGAREYGKTTILHQIAIQEITTKPEAQRAIPIVISFSDLKRPLSRTLRTLVTSLPVELPIETRFVDILENGLALILVDDVDPKNKDGLEILREFLKKYPRNRFVLAADSGVFREMGTVPSLGAPVPFNKLFIGPLSRTRMRELVQKLGDGMSANTNDILERMLADFLHINVPLTAVNGTIMITIFQASRDFRPINRADLIERFVELLLEKYAFEETRRESFNFRMKELFLAELAESMVNSDNYNPEYNTVLSFTTTYFKRYGLRYPADSLLEQFVRARILERNGDHIKFRYRAFAEFFIARRMVDDTQFRGWVLSDEQYLSFINEIEYYSGITKNDEALLDLIGSRMAELSQKIFGEGDWAPDPTLFAKMRSPKSRVASDVYRDVERQMKLPQLSDAEQDALRESEIPAQLGQKQDIFRPLYSDDATRWHACLILYSKVLRNLEVIDNDKKLGHLREIFLRWSEFTVLSLVLIPILVEHRSIILNGIRYEVLADPDLSNEEVAHMIYLSMPRAVTNLISVFMGSEKLEVQLERELPFAEGSEPEIIKFYRSCLYGDLKLKGFISVLGELERGLRGTKYLYEALMWKLRDTLTKASLSEEEHEQLRRLTGRMLGSIGQQSQADRTQRISKEIQRLDKAKIVERLRRRNRGDEGGTRSDPEPENGAVVVGQNSSRDEVGPTDAGD